MPKTPRSLPNLGGPTWTPAVGNGPDRGGPSEPWTWVSGLPRTARLDATVGDGDTAVRESRRIPLSGFGARPLSYGV